MAEFINSIDVLGDDAVNNSIIDRSITEFKDDTISVVGAYAFYGCSSITSVELPNATELGDYSLAGCTSMTEFEFPEVLNVKTGAFGSNLNVKSIRLPKVVTIQNAILQSYSALEELYIPLCKKLNNSGFNGCSKLQKEKCDFGSVEEITGATFYQASGLGPIIDCFPKLRLIGKGLAFANALLEAADFPVLEQLGAQSLSLNGTFRTLILRRNNTVCALGNINALSGTRFAAGSTGGVLLIPSTLVESYKTSTNWSVIYGYGTNRFIALEDYTVDGTTTGAIDWDKVDALF